MYVYDGEKIENVGVREKTERQKKYVRVKEEKRCLREEEQIATVRERERERRERERRERG